MIIINGKELKTKFNYYAIEQFAKVVGDAGSNVVYTVRVLWGGYLGYCFSKQVEPEITYSEILDWLDENIDNEQSVNDIVSIKDEWAKSVAFEKLIKKGLQTQGEKEKKSPTPIVDIQEQLPGTTYTPSFGEQSDLNQQNITT